MSKKTLSAQERLRNVCDAVAKTTCFSEEVIELQDSERVKHPKLVRARIGMREYNVFGKLAQLFEPDKIPHVQLVQTKQVAVAVVPQEGPPWVAKKYIKESTKATMTTRLDGKSSGIDIVFSTSHGDVTRNITGDTNKDGSGSNAIGGSTGLKPT